MLIVVQFYGLNVLGLFTVMLVLPLIMLEFLPHQIIHDLFSWRWTDFGISLQSLDGLQL